MSKRLVPRHCFLIAMAGGRVPWPGRLVALAFAAFLATHHAHAQEFSWAGAVGGQITGVAVDFAGNVYAVGDFGGTANFDPGGLSTLTTTGGIDIFVVKLDSTRHLVWAKKMGGTSNDRATGVALDSTGALYITGTFSATADFDPGAGTFNLTSGGMTDPFVVRLDSAGNFVWAVSAGGTAADTAMAIAIAPSGTVVAVGEFFGTVDFDPGPGTTTLTAPSNFNTFVWKLNASGALVWAKGLIGTGPNFNGPGGVAVDATGNVHVSGRFVGTADFDPGPGTANMSSVNGFYDVYVVKLDASGGYAWARRTGGLTSDEASGVAVDGGGNVVVAGYFSGSADFDPGAGVSTLTSAGGNDVFVWKLDSAGLFLWARAMGGATADEAQSVTVDLAGNVYTGGNFTGTADFDPGPNHEDLTSAGVEDAFISKLDSSGTLVWGKRMGGAGFETVFSFVADATGDLYPSGAFHMTGDFDPGPGTYTLSNTGAVLGFAVRLSTCGVPFVDRDGYGQLLFPLACTLDAGSLTQNQYDARSLSLLRPRVSDVFYLSSRGDRFAPLVVDDQAHIDAADVGLGPYTAQPGAPPFRLNAPIEFNWVPQPSLNATPFISNGLTTLSFSLHDIQRTVYGHTAVYLVPDCGIRVTGGTGTRIHFLSHDDQVAGEAPRFEVRYGLLSELRADGNFTRSACLGRFTSSPATDPHANPSTGDSWYYVARGTVRCLDQGYGDSTLVPDPRDALDNAPLCP